MKYLDGGANKNVIIHVKLICEHCRQKKNQTEIKPEIDPT